jgi:glyoxylase-like metal-dependent hydrolase (beta-lactamase superfamily II)
MDGGGFFGLVPRAMWQKVIAPDTENRIPADTRCLLVESDAGPILVDCGHGDKMDAKQRERWGLSMQDERLISQMRAVGIAPEEVAIVLLTHLHGDHAGGATRFTPDQPGGLAATFPNARYIGQRIDLAAAVYPNERTAATYVADNWRPLLESGQLEVVDGPQQLARGVRTQMAPGHTDALQVVWVEDGGESLLFLGDAANWAVHLERLAWVPAFDIDPMTAIETKRALRVEAQARNALLVFQHDAHVVTGRLVEGARGPVVQPELTRDPWMEEFER